MLSDFRVHHGDKLDQLLTELLAALMKAGVLAKDTHGSTIRLAPPLVVEEPEVELLVDTLGRVLR